MLSNVLIAPTWPGTLLAKELAGVDGVSGGRLTVGIGVGIRADDFVAEGYGLRGRGARLDRDLETFRDVWRGEPVGGANPAVPAGTRRIPLLFGGMTAAAMNRMARWGEGYIGPSAPAAMVEPSFEAARAAWRHAGRDGSPRLVAIAYFSLADGEKGRTNVYVYYSVSGVEVAELVAGTVSTTPEAVRTVVSEFAGLGADEIVLNPGTDDLDEIKRLADAVL